MLARLEAAGMGERRAEGYGQLRLQAGWLARPLAGISGGSAAAASTTVVEAPAGDGLAVSSAGTEADEAAPFLRLRRPVEQPGDSWASHVHDYARLLERMALKAAIRRASLGLAASEEKRRLAPGLTGRKPSSSQLGALRSRIARLPDPRAQQDEAAAYRLVSEPLQRWLGHLGEVGNRERRWPEGSLARVTSLVGDPARVWELLELPDDTLRGSTITARKLGLHKLELWSEAVRMLVEDCLQAQARQQEAAGEQLATPAKEG